MGNGVVFCVNRRHPYNLPAQFAGGFHRGGIQTADVIVENNPAVDLNPGHGIRRFDSAGDGVLVVALDDNPTHLFTPGGLGDPSIVGNPIEQTGVRVHVDVYGAFQ